MSARSRSIPTPALVEIVRYTAVDDVGRAVNPLILHGQTHGGIAQGVGQALWEHCHYDPDERAAAVRLVHGLRDAARRHAAVVRDRARRDAVAAQSARHPRAAAKAAPRRRSAVVVNAIVDALSDYGVTHIEMPATPERVWRAIRQDIPAAGV